MVVPLQWSTINLCSLVGKLSIFLPNSISSADSLMIYGRRTTKLLISHEKICLCEATEVGVLTVETGAVVLERVVMRPTRSMSGRLLSVDTTPPSE